MLPALAILAALLFLQAAPQAPERQVQVRVSLLAVTYQPDPTGRVVVRVENQHSAAVTAYAVYSGSTGPSSRHWGVMLGDAMVAPEGRSLIEPGQSGTLDLGRIAGGDTNELRTLAAV